MLAACHGARQLRMTIELHREGRQLIAAILLALIVTPTQAEEAQADDIIVRAVRHKCEVRIADRILSDPEFNAHAKEWAQGKPVRVIAPAHADYKCLAKIAFRLNDKGVRRMYFVDPADAAKADAAK